MRNMVFIGLFALAGIIYSTPAQAQYYGQCWMAYCQGNGECMAYDAGLYEDEWNNCQSYGGFPTEEEALRNCANKTQCTYPTHVVTCYTGYCRQLDKFGCGSYEEQFRVEIGQGCPGNMKVTDKYDGATEVTRQAFTDRKSAVDYFCKNAEGEVKDPNICTPSIGATKCYYNMEVGRRWVTKDSPVEVPYGSTTCPESGMTRWDGEQDLYQTYDDAVAARPGDGGSNGGATGGTGEPCYMAKCSYNRDVISDPTLKGCESRPAPGATQDAEGNCPTDFTLNDKTIALFKTQEEAIADCAQAEICLPDMLYGEFFLPTKRGDTCSAQRRNIRYSRVDGPPATENTYRYGELPLYSGENAEAEATQYCEDNPEKFVGGSGGDRGGNTGAKCYFAKCSFNREVINDPAKKGCEARPAPGINQDENGNCPAEYNAGNKVYPLFSDAGAAVADCATTDICLPEMMYGEFFLPNKRGDVCGAQRRNIRYARSEGPPATETTYRYGELPLFSGESAQADATQYCTDNPEKFNVGGGTGGGTSTGDAGADRCWVMECSRRGAAVRSTSKRSVGGECSGNGVFADQSAADAALTAINTCKNSSPVYFQNFTSGNCVPESCNAGEGDGDSSGGATRAVRAPAARAARAPAARATSESDLTGDQGVQTPAERRMIDREPDVLDKSSRKTTVAPRLRRGENTEPLAQPKVRRNRGLVQ